jgi:hypothetical protein
MSHMQSLDKPLNDEKKGELAAVTAVFWIHSISVNTWPHFHDCQLLQKDRVSVVPSSPTGAVLGVEEGTAYDRCRNSMKRGKEFGGPVPVDLCSRSTSRDGLLCDKQVSEKWCLTPGDIH